MSHNWLFLDLNSYFASVEQAVTPSLQGKPVAVVPLMADTTSCLAASYPAKKFGIRTGTSVREAKRLCPDIILIEADHRKYVHYHKKIIAAVEQLLHISSVLSIDELACELMGHEKEEAFILRKAREIKSALLDISPALTCSIGIAPNRLLAKIATDMQKPNGLVVIHQHELPHRLAQLKLRDFPGIGPRMEERCRARGCRTAEDLIALSPDQMRQLWGGVVGERFWKLLRGENLIPKEHNRSSISHSSVLSPQSRNSKDAFTIASRLLVKAAMRLREQGFFARDLLLDVKYLTPNPAERHYYARARFSETQDTFFFLDELKRLWKDVPLEKFLKVGVVLSGFTPAERHQFSLFENPRQASLMRTLDTLNKKYQDNILYPEATQKALKRSRTIIAFNHIPEEFDG